MRRTCWLLILLLTAPSAAAASGKFHCPEGHETGDPAFLGLSPAKDENGVEVRAVIADAPAHLAGVLPGDRILAIAGVEVAERSLPEVRRLLRCSLEGEPFRLTLERAGVPFQTELVPVARPQAMARLSDEWLRQADEGREPAVCIGEDVLEGIEIIRTEPATDDPSS